MPVSPEARKAREAKVLACLDAFAAEHGHVNIHQSYKAPDGYPIGRILHEIRLSRRKGTLDPDFEAELTKRGVIWDPGKSATVGGRPDREFAQFVGCLKEYAAVHGHTNPRQRDVCPEHGTRIGRALTRKREADRAGRLPDHQRTILIDLGVTLDQAEVAALGAASPNRENTYLAHKEQTWAKALSVFLDYFNAGGDLNLVVRNRDYPGYPRLGKHLAAAHTAHAEGTLPPDVAAELEAMGIVWAGGADRNSLHRHEARMDRVCAAMATFVTEHGHGEVPREYRTDGGAWLYDALTALRTLASQDRLSQHDRDRLAAAGAVVPAPGQGLREATMQARSRPRPAAVTDEHILELRPLDDPAPGKH